MDKLEATNIIWSAVLDVGVNAECTLDEFFNIMWHNDSAKEVIRQLDIDDCKEVMQAAWRRI